MSRTTNAEIIALERFRLFDNGLINGQEVMIEEDGIEKTFYIPEEIHTYAKWKTLGYQVQRGEKAITKIPIWCPIGKKADEDSDSESGPNGKKIRMYLKTAAFFTIGQCEAIDN